MAFDLNAYSSNIRSLIGEFADRCLSPERIGSSRLREAMRYSFFSGGKRIRPLLVYAAAETVRSSCGTSPPEQNPLPEIIAGAAVEAIHTYSLVHDDLPAMDDDDLRRGKPTCHRAFDEATAILAGDALLNLAFEILMEGVERYGAPMIRAAGEIVRASGGGGMVSGQMLDLQATDTDPTPEGVQEIHTKKTGALLKASVLAGAHVAEAEPSMVEHLSRFGECIGLAFQIVDDLLDLEKTTEQIGKRAGKDLEQRKTTYPAAFGVSASRKKAEDLTHQAEDSLAYFGGCATPLLALADLILRREY